MKKQVRLLIVLVTIMALLASVVVFAVPGNGGGKDVLHGYEKQLKNFTMIDGNRIRLNKSGVDFDTPPVIKEGRTLIPVRAIMEAMGAIVTWDNDEKIATIISADGLIIIKFYLDEEDDGLITVTEDGVTTSVSLDVKHGLYNNRTYVPLRFLAETLGLKVGYNNSNGQISIDSEPVLSPKKVTYELMEDVPLTVDVDVILNGYEFMGIEGLTSGVEYTTSGAITVQLKKSYIETLVAEETEFNFVFEKDTVEVTKTFELKLKYNDEDFDEPVLSPKKVEYASKGEIPDTVDVNVTLNGYEFSGIEGLVYDTHYTTSGAIVVHLDKTYVESLTNEETKLRFMFQKGAIALQKEFELKLTYNYESEKPVLTPEEAEYMGSNIVIDVDYNGFTLLGISHKGTLLAADTDYTVSGDWVTLKTSYLDSLEDDEAKLHFLFEKDGEFASVKFEVEMEEDD